MRHYVTRAGWIRRVVKPLPATIVEPRRERVPVARWDGCLADFSA